MTAQGLKAWGRTMLPTTTTWQGDTVIIIINYITKKIFNKNNQYNILGFSKPYSMQ